MITNHDLAAAQKACDDYTLTEPNFTPAALPPVSPPPDGILSATAGVSTLAPVTDLSSDGCSIPADNVHPVAGVTLQDQCRSLIAHWGNVAKLYRDIGGVSAVARAEENEMHSIQLERLLK